MALLRLAGVVTVAAFLAIFLPADWMAATHRWTAWEGPSITAFGIAIAVLNRRQAGSPVR